MFSRNKLTLLSEAAAMVECREETGTSQNSAKESSRASRLTMPSDADFKQTANANRTFGPTDATCATTSVFSPSIWSPTVNHVQRSHQNSANVSTCLSETVGRRTVETQTQTQTLSNGQDCGAAPVLDAKTNAKIQSNGATLINLNSISQLGIAPMQQQFAVNSAASRSGQMPMHVENMSSYFSHLHSAIPAGSGVIFVATPYQLTTFGPPQQPLHLTLTGAHIHNSAASLNAESASQCNTSADCGVRAAQQTVTDSLSSTVAEVTTARPFCPRCLRTSAGPCSCTGRTTGTSASTLRGLSDIGDLKLRLVEFDAESAMESNNSPTPATSLCQSSEIVNEKLSSSCLPTIDYDSQSQLSRPYKKRKVVRAFSDVTAERRARAQTLTLLDSTQQSNSNIDAIAAAEASEYSSQTSLAHSCSFAHGPSRRRLQVAAASSVRSQSPFFGSLRSGASSPCSSLSGSCTNFQLDASASPLAATCTSDTLNEFRGLSIGSVASTSAATTPVGSSGYATDLQCFASPGQPADALKANRSVVILNFDPDEQLEEHFSRSLQPPHALQHKGIKITPDRLDKRLYGLPVQRAASSATQSHKAIVKRTESCPQAPKRPAPASPPVARATNKFCYISDDPNPNKTGHNAHIKPSFGGSGFRECPLPSHANSRDAAASSCQRGSANDARLKVCIVEESNEVDDHFRKALGVDWKNVPMPTQPAEMNNCAKLIDSDAFYDDTIEVTYL